MSKYYSVADLERLFQQDDLASAIVSMYERWDHQRAGWKAEKTELRNYLFATDTSTTLDLEEGADWHNRTTLPKLCQIRDNLHANYISSLFPNDNWMKWEGATQKDEVREKRQIIQTYMQNKFLTGEMQKVYSQLLLDYIDYGVAICDTIWVNETKTDVDGNVVPVYVGPMPVRVSPLDCVFDITASSFRQAPKITRTLISIGEFKRMIVDNPEEWAQDSIEYIENIRRNVAHISHHDLEKHTAVSADGFGNLHEYYGSGYVEVLEFEGSFTHPETGELMDDYIVTVIDRAKVVRKEPIPGWKRGGHKVMTQWRKRPDNLMGMGPLDNLVGMQYRLDQMENAKADAWDLIITPAWKVKGDVEADFDFYPGVQIDVGENGDVEPLTYPKEALMANNEIGQLMAWMEEFAGAPKQAMGIRTPGEKTAFEVQALENAAGRIFQEKIVQFEKEMLEPTLNHMLELAVRNMGAGDVIRVLDDDFGVAIFKEITADDIKASGLLRPVGARHFSQRAQLLQNLTGVTNSPVWQKVERHFSDKALANMIEDVLQLERFSVVNDNAALFEQADSQRLAQQLQEDVAVEQATPLEEDDAPPLA